MKLCIWAADDGFRTVKCEANMRLQNVPNCGMSLYKSFSVKNCSVVMYVHGCNDKCVVFYHDLQIKLLCQITPQKKDIFKP